MQLTKMFVPSTIRLIVVILLPNSTWDFTPFIIKMWPRSVLATVRLTRFWPTRSPKKGKSVVEFQVRGGRAFNLEESGGIRRTSVIKATSFSLLDSNRKLGRLSLSPIHWRKKKKEKSTWKEFSSLIFIFIILASFVSSKSIFWQSKKKKKQRTSTKEIYAKNK